MNELLKRATSLLAQRDYSEWELRRKLTRQSSWKKGENGRSPTYSINNIDKEIVETPNTHQYIDQVIEYCYQHNWLDDRRFAEQFIYSRSNKGYGPRRIILELQQKGVTKSIIEQTLQESNIQWKKLAESVVQKKFGKKINNDMKNKVKIANFLIYRGFDPRLFSSYFDNYYI